MNYIQQIEEGTYVPFTQKARCKRLHAMISFILNLQNGRNPDDGKLVTYYEGV